MWTQTALKQARRLLQGLIGRPSDDLPHVGDWSQSRAEPVDDDRVMQSHTHRWLRTIPSSLHPKQLCRHYPRIANRLAVNWQHVHVVDRLLNDLLFDRRGGRRGFSPRIRQEIQRLYSYHAKRLTPAAHAPRPQLHAAQERVE